MLAVQTRNRQVPKISLAKLIKRIKVSTPECVRWRWGSALFDSKGRVRRDHVMVAGRDEIHPEGSYYLEWWDEGKRYREPVGPNAFVGAEKLRVKQAELTAVRNGIIPAPLVIESNPERKTLEQALDSYKEYVQYHRSR